MKVIVELDYNIDDFKLLSVNSVEEYFKEYFSKTEGILYNEKLEAIYYECDIPYFPIVGQEVNCKFGNCNVTYSCLSLDENQNGYFDKSRIMVKDI